MGIHDIHIKSQQCLPVPPKDVQETYKKIWHQLKLDQGENGELLDEEDADELHDELLRLEENYRFSSELVKRLRQE